MSDETAQHDPPSPGPRRPTNRTVVLASALGAVLVVGVVVAVLLATSGGPGTKEPASALARTTTVETKGQLLSDVTMVPFSGSTNQDPMSTVAVHATGARLESVHVIAPALGSRLAGGLNATGDEWLSTGALHPSTAYVVTYTVEGTGGLVATGSGRFTTASTTGTFVGNGPTGYTGGAAGRRRRSPSGGAASHSSSPSGAAGPSSGVGGGQTGSSNSLGGGQGGQGSGSAGSSGLSGGGGTSSFSPTSSPSRARPGPAWVAVVPSGRRAYPGERDQQLLAHFQPVVGSLGYVGLLRGRPGRQ